MINPTLFSLKSINSNTNTVLNAIDYKNNSDILAFAASNIIHINCISKVKTFLTLQGHRDRVNSVKFLDSLVTPNKKFEILSISSDSTTIHWKNETNEPFNYLNWKIENIYKSSDEKNPLNCLTTLYINDNEIYFSTFGAGSNLDFWRFDTTTKVFIIQDTICYKKKLQETLCLAVLNKENLILMSGGYDSLIHFYTINRHLKEQKLTQKLTLKGHMNSLRDISYLDKITFPSFKQRFIASCSQDNYIRIWSINKIKNQQISNKKIENIFEEYTNKTSFVLKTDSKIYNILLDSVLSGHEDSVSSIRWGIRDKKLVLLSSSFDFTISIWEFDNIHNIWNKSITLGNLNGNKHSFYSAIFIENFNAIIGYTFNGALYLWRDKKNEKQWKSEPIVHGHFGAVSDLDWDYSKNYFVTCSEDQTTRLFSNWVSNDTWVEINRPQIHGYDLNSISCLFLQNNVVSRIVSASDEKITRIFEPTFNIVKFLEQTSNVNIRFSKENENSYYEKYFSSLEASKQSLGLMNRQVKVEANEEDENALEIMNFDPTELLTNKQNEYNKNYDYSQPPDEDFLTNNTLWPETNKLYGHGYDIFALATDHKGTLIASSSKAQSEKHSKLFLWNPENFNLITRLDGHKLTIVQIEFNHNDDYILTVSRDRSWCLYKKQNDEKNPYILTQVQEEAHARIIWGCSWTINDKYFATGSRDKSIKIWGRDQDKFIEFGKTVLEQPITAVNFAPIVIGKDTESHALFVGMENGNISIMRASVKKNECLFVNLFTIHKFICHSLLVKRIKSVVREENLVVASCSEDFSVRVFMILEEEFTKNYLQ